MPRPLPEALPDPLAAELGELLAAADRLADRYRSMPHGRLTALAADGLALARRLARAAQRLEGGPSRGELPEAGAFVVGDQIALAAHDLAAALRGRGGGEPDSEAAAVLAAATAAVADGYRLATTRSARM
ncbi:hypothetical protein [Streptacidiphilus sp. EB129]|jgi:hypothetical protein|uniref:hypothetical protein n=1 Tax=Streptacidiphilus sp. EB129 TaxID=3156262 RepID=UPI003513B7DE